MTTQTQQADPSVRLKPIIPHPVKRKPIPVRSLADRLADPNTLTLPFTQAEINHLLKQYVIYEHLNDVCFPDFGAFISHIVPEQLQGGESCLIKK